MYQLAPGEPAGPYASQVAPRITARPLSFAPGGPALLLQLTDPSHPDNHQHLFSLRIDPMLDGLANSVVETDIIQSAHPTGSEENWAGNAFGAVKTVLRHTGEGKRMACADKERSWSIIGPRVNRACVPPRPACPDFSALT